MKIVVWAVSILLALAFLAVGGMKLLTPAADLGRAANGIPVALMKVAGAAEVLGAVGLILPAATRITPVLTPLAAVGLTATMVGATIANVVVGAYSAVPMTVVLGLAAALIAWARFGRCAVEPRSRATAVMVG